MHDRFTMNMEFLREHDQNLANRLSGLHPGTEFEVCKAQSCHFTVRQSLNDGSYRFVHSRVDPAREAEAWTSHQRINKNGAVILGLGLAYHASEFIKTYSDCSAVYLIEASHSLFRLALDICDLSAILSDKRVHLCIGCDPKMFKDWASGALTLSFSYHTFLPATALYPEFYTTMIENLEQQHYRIRSHSPEHKEYDDRRIFAVGVEKLLEEMIL